MLAFKGWGLSSKTPAVYHGRPYSDWGVLEPFWGFPLDHQPLSQARRREGGDLEPKPSMGRKRRILSTSEEEQARKMDERDLERALALVLDLERGLKGGSDLTDELQVELAVLKLS